jgi:hypothetical protein
LDKILTMRRLFSSLVIATVFVGLLFSSCGKSDPAPLGAQTNAKLLAGDAGKSKTWKIVSIGYKQGTNSGSYTLDPCFVDNLWTFTNNAAQDYQANEGASKCSTNSPDLIELGTWAFTLDGILLDIGVDEVNTINGLFSPDAIIIVSDGTNSYPLTVTYPYPATVVKLTADQMILEMNWNIVNSLTTYTLTFIAQ